MTTPARAPTPASPTVLPERQLSLSAGHRACLGCGEALGCRLALDAAREKVSGGVIVANATGCLEVFSSSYPYSSWNVPWLHSLFENAPAVATGIAAALRAQGRTGPGSEDIRVVAQGGDGGTADIGLQALSGMFERGEDVLYICYDNEAYMNTGVQRSGLTPPGARTTTTPVAQPGVMPASTDGYPTGAAFGQGNARPKKDMPAIAVAHGVPYVATATIGYYGDLERKLKAAMTVRGPRYVHVHVPCPLGWGFDSKLTIKIAQLAVQTGLFPVVEYEHGKLTRARKLRKRPSVEAYLQPQVRFAHLFKTEEGKTELAHVQAVADANVERYGLG